MSYKKMILVLTAIMTSHLVMGGQERVSKKITKSYSMTNVGELYLDNKYGNININGWNKNTIEITIDIIVTHKKIESAKNLLDRIKPNIKVLEDFVAITSEINEKKSNFYTKYIKKTNPFGFNKSNIQIDYTINLPIKSELNITNKFGDILIKNWIGSLKCDIKYGDVWINDSINSIDAIIKHGKIKAQYIKHSKIRVKNGSIDIKESQDLRINSSGTVIKIDTINYLEMYSSKDEINITNAEEIKGELKFSNMEINNINKKIDLSTKLSKLKIIKASNPNIQILINQESSDINININEMTFLFDAVLEEGLLRLPKTMQNINTKMIDKVKKIRKIEASYGKELTGKISIVGKKGDIFLKIIK